jgi:hypothetical protein
MIENLKRIREPLAWIAIVLTVAGMGLAVWRLVTDFGEMSVFAAFQEVGSSWLNISFALLVVVIVMSCSLVAPATPRARLLTRIAAVVLSLGVALTLVSALMGMWASAVGLAVILDVFGGLLDVAFKALTAAALWVFLRGVKAGRIETASRVVPLPTQAAAGTDAESSTATTWSRDQAVGTVWRTAADAAAGAPGRDTMGEDQESKPAP